MVQEFLILQQGFVYSLNQTIILINIEKNSLFNLKVHHAITGEVSETITEWFDNNGISVWNKPTSINVPKRQKTKKLWVHTYTYL